MFYRDWPWFTIIQKTRPLIGMVNFEEELRILEEAAKEKYGAYKDQLDTKAKLEEENVELAKDLEEVRATISREQGEFGYSPCTHYSRC